MLSIFLCTIIFKIVSYKLGFFFLMMFLNNYSMDFSFLHSNGEIKTLFLYGKTSSSYFLSAKL